MIDPISNLQYLGPIIGQVIPGASFNQLSEICAAVFPNSFAIDSTSSRILHVLSFPYKWDEIHSCSEKAIQGVHMNCDSSSTQWLLVRLEFLKGNKKCYTISRVPKEGKTPFLYFPDNQPPQRGPHGITATFSLWHTQLKFELKILTKTDTY